MNTQTFKKRINPAYTKAGKVNSWYFGAIESIAMLQTGKKVHPCRWNRNLGHHSLNDKSYRILELLDWAKISYERGNDAPRGGKEGDYIVLTAAGKRALKNVDLNLNNL